MFVKIVASLGPSSSSIDVVRGMIREGVDVFRINFAHGDEDQWRSLLSIVREAERDLSRPVGVLGDLQGPSVRIGMLDKPVEIRRGDVVTFIYGEKSGDNRVPVPVREFFEGVEVGVTLVLDDGRTRLQVIEKSGDSVKAVALNNAVITSRKAVDVYGKELDLPLLSDRDKRALKFAIENEVDYIGLSFVRSPNDVQLAKRIIRELGGDIPVISKIETRSAVKNLDRIIEESDAVMVARGDLGMNFSLEEVHYLQRIIVRESIKHGKPVLVATQFLESMIRQEVPTRAEVVDISVAVEHGVDAIVLTGETAVGSYPIEAVKWLRKVITFTEERVVPELADSFTRRARGRELDLPTRFALGVIELAERLNAKIVVFTMRGNTPTRMCSLRPRVPIIAGTPSIRVARRLSMLWGVQPLIVEADNYEDGLKLTLEKAIEKGFVKLGETVVLTYGLREPLQRVTIMQVV